jgi:hypothetical protein
MRRSWARPSLCHGATNQLTLSLLAVFQPFPAGLHVAKARPCWPIVLSLPIVERQRHAGSVPEGRGFSFAGLGFSFPVVAQNSGTNQDDPVSIHKCAWLTTHADGHLQADPGISLGRPKEHHGDPLCAANMPPLKAFVSGL